MQPSDKDNAKLVGQIENWRNRLLDIGNRNPLINASFHPTRGVLELMHPQSEMIWTRLVTAGEAGSRSLTFPWKRDLVPQAKKGSTKTAEGDDPEINPAEDKDTKDWNPPIADCLASRRLGSDDLLTSLGDRALDRRIRALDGYAKLSISEQGMHCLFLAFGFIKWFESGDSTKEIRSPLILVPATFNRETSDSPWELQEAEDDVIDNLCLRQRFKEDFNLVLPPMPELEQLEEEGARLAYLAELKRAIAKNERWDIEDRCCLGRFAFPKIAMWQDLGEHIQSIANNLICRSIAGKIPDDPQIAFGDPSSVPDSKQLDDAVSPGEIKAILDCDSSQLEAIVAARKGISFVLDGPPGTGKSQTIANIIADAMSLGKRVLFVSEKVAALEVVKRRLDESGLGDFCLECHSSKANRKALLEELKGCLEIPIESYPDPNPKLNDLRQQRQTLNDYVRTLHAPQQPVGLSMYELHGNIARLMQRNMIGKSQVSFKNPRSISRADLDSWIQTLQLADQHKNVIAGYSVHPWRGCKLTNPPLALKSDIRRNFTLLADCCERLANEMRPFVEEKLLPETTKLKDLPSIIESLEANLRTPEIQSSWLTDPQDVANILLDRFHCYQVITTSRQSLTEYVDNVTSLFKSKDIVPLSDIGSCKWLPKLLAPLPDNYDACVESLGTQAQKLRHFEELLSNLDSSLKRLIDELKLPIKLDLPIGTIGKLITASRLICTDAPFQPSWFDEEKANTFIASSQQVLSHIESMKQLESIIQDRIDPSALARLARDTPDLKAFQQNWEVVRSQIPDSRIQALEDYENQLSHDIDKLKRIVDDTKNLSDRLQFNGAFVPTLSDVHTLLQALPDLCQAKSYHGRWGDTVTRQNTKRKIESAILDLTEAQDLRRTLEHTFSHRAFAPTARPLIEGGKRFDSWWSRFFGGFSKYRKEIADFYKSPVPATNALLRDLSQLGTFHKRMREVESVFQELKDLLLSDTVPDQIDSWQKNLTALNAFESFIAKISGVTSALPSCSVTVDLQANDPLVSRLTENINQLLTIEPESHLGKLGLNGSPMSQSLASANNLKTSLQSCSKVMRAVSNHYRVAPTVEQIQQDLVTANVYAQQQASVESLFTAHVTDLPANAKPFQVEGWIAGTKGVESARKLIRTFGSSAVLQEVVCHPGQLNLEKLAEIANATEFALLQVNAVWPEKVEFINLTRGGEQEIEPRRRVTTELKSCVAEAAAEFETLKERIAKLVSVLKPGKIVPFDRLSQDASAIDRMRVAEVALEDRNAFLSALGVIHPLELSEGDVKVANWIRQTPDKVLQSPMVRAIATNSNIRSGLERLLGSMREVTPQMSDPISFLHTIFDQSENVSSGFVLKELSLERLANVLRELVLAVDLIDEWIPFNRWRGRLGEMGLAVVMKELLRQDYQPHEAVDAVCAKLYQQLFDHFMTSLPCIADFDSLRHEQIREKYCQLDKWEIKAASARVREFQLNRVDRPRIGWHAPMTSELGILKKETEKKRRHMPLRKLFAAVPGVLQRLKPCIMMSPLSVSTFLQSEELKFDLVIFDEASQVFPWDAIGAVYRGTQLIVAGDDKQLPPTSFFSRADIESEEEDEDIGDFESILSLCKSVNMPNKRLRWHYRSRREPLIAFSNRHFYEGDLVTFPSILDATSNAVRLIHVPNGLWIDRKNLVEARKVAELVVTHYRATPEKSLGVIAFNISQQQAIEDALYDLRRSSPEIDALFSAGSNEPLFIKNLENVQGDERDVILLSFGYGKNEAGKFIKNFGPLSKPGGERRLNVAVTRAREAVYLVASVRAADMDLSGSTSTGASLLKSYLEYAELGVDSLGRTIVETQSECESPFEEEVAAALIRHGLEPVPQVGCGGFRIDLALKHPSNPGIYCLGIECDGATYHSSKTARDRDRIRQNVLEGLGWRICRVWSTDWVRNPQLQIQRILAAFQQASTETPESRLEANTQSEAEFEDLQPEYIAEADVIAPTYLKIDDVPTTLITDTALRIVTRVGTIDWSELITLISRELGFARTGKRIRDRIEAELTEQVHQSILHRNGDRVSAVGKLPNP